LILEIARNGRPHLEDRTAITSGKDDYNTTRPHLALDNITPTEFGLRSALEKRAARGRK